MQKITTLLAALALTTSCSLQLDSQYGLRWDRRVLAPKDQTAHSESNSDQNTPVRNDLTSQNVRVSSQLLTNAWPNDEIINRQHIDQADLSTTSPSNQKEPFQESRTAPTLSQNSENDNLQDENAPIVVSGSSAAQYGLIGFLMFILFVTAIFSALLTLIAFYWWIPANGASVFSGILPLLITFASIWGLIKLGKKMNMIREQFRSETEGQSA